MTSIAISSGRQKSTFTILVVVNFLSWVFHAVVVDSLLLSIDVIFPIPVIELIPMFNTMHNFLNFAFPLQVFIQPCSIGDKWQFLGFARFVGFKELASNFHSFLVIKLLFLIPYGLPYVLLGSNQSHCLSHFPIQLYFCGQPHKFGYHHLMLQFQGHGSFFPFLNFHCLSLPHERNCFWGRWAAYCS